MHKLSKFNKFPLRGLEHIIVTGQSLGSGTHGIPLLNTNARGHRYLMFNGGAWGYGSQDKPNELDLGRFHHLVPHRPTISSTYYTQIGETIFMGFREYLFSKGYPDGHRSMLFSNVAAGGRYLWCMTKAGLALSTLSYSSPWAYATTVYPYGTQGNLYTGTNWQYEVYGTSDPRFHGFVVGQPSVGLIVPYQPLFTPGASATGGYLRGPFYGQSLEQMRQAKNITRGYPYKVGAILNVHGEGDRDNTDYDIQLRGWANNYDTDAKALSGQSEDVYMFNSQVSSFLVDQWNNKLMIDEHNQGLKNVLVCPKYFLDHWSGDGVHLTTLSQDRLGEYYGRAYYQKVVLGQSYDPLFMSSVWHGVGASVCIAIFNKEVTIDTTNVTEKSDLGFTAVDGSGGIGITRVTIPDPDNLDRALVEFSRAINGTLQLQYAWGGTGGHGGPSTGPRGNIRALATPETGPLTGYPMYDWACHQQIQSTPV